MDQLPIKLFSSLFKGREDVYPLCPDGSHPYPINEPVTDDVVRKHLDGRHMMGVYPVLRDGTCHFIAVDFDNHHGSGRSKQDAFEYINLCRHWQLPCYLERSRSGNGFHAWIFFEEPVLAYKAIGIVKHLLQGLPAETREPFETFPKQARVQGKGKELGNLIVLPLHGGKLKEGNTAFLDPQHL